MKIFDSPQRSEGWYKERAGHFTMSGISDLFMGKSTSGYQNAINKVVYERITGDIPVGYSNKAMERGVELEPIAREAYQLETFNYVQEVGFIELDEWIGVSVDGLIGDNGTLEIKCPEWAVMVGYSLTKTIPKDYIFQMQGGLYVTGRAFCDYWVFHDKLKPILIRVERDETIIADISTKLTIAIQEAKDRIKQIQGVI